MAESSRDYSFWVKIATRASVSVALILIIAKGTAWWLTGSASMLASLTDSSLDTLASLFTFFAVRYALVPADKEHRHGHGKAEALAAFIQSILIFISAILLIIHSLQQWSAAETVQRIDAGIYVSILAIILTSVLVTLQHKAIQNTSSAAIAADKLHYTSDLLLNSAVIVALALSAWDLWWADSVIAIGIAAYLLWNAVQIARGSLHTLLDRELPEDERQLIIKTIRETIGVQGFHGLRTRSAGPTRFISCHIELEDHLTLKQAHDIADDTEHRLQDLFESTDVLVHMDPQSIIMDATTPSPTGSPRLNINQP